MKRISKSSRRLLLLNKMAKGARVRSKLMNANSASAANLHSEAVLRLAEVTNEVLREKGATSPDSLKEFEKGYSGVLLGEELRRLRVAAGLTQVQVANSLALTQARISQIERGSGSGDEHLSIGLAFKFAKACGFSMGFNFSGVRIAKVKAKSGYDVIKTIKPRRGKELTEAQLRKLEQQQ
jgi:transcriptional regulator with XRE-family HTH domain